MSVGKKTTRTCLAVGLSLGLFTCGQAFGETPFDREIQAIVNEIVPQIKAYIDEHPGQKVTIGTFENRSDTQPSPGTSIGLLLKEGLTKLGIPLANRSGNLKIYGTFQPGSDEKTGKPATEIVTIVQDITDPTKPKVLVTNKRIVVDPVSTLEKNGGNVNLDPKATPKERDQAIVQAIAAPQVFVETDKSRVRTTKESPYAIEVRVDGRPREVEMKDGVPYVTLKTGESFVVRLINDSKREAGVALSIDGINSFTFQDGKVGAKATPMNDWTVKAGELGDIPGWYIDASTIEKFEITENPSEIAAMTISSDSSDVGTITAVFKASWAVGETPPDDEPKTQAVAGAKAPQVGVKRGAAVAFHGPPRMTICGVIRDSITIRYQKPGTTSPTEAVKP